MCKKIVSLILCLCIIASVSLFATGCKSSGGDYPVTVGNLTFEEEPQNVVVLSDCIADIIEYIGYEVKFVGRSDEVTQESLSIVPSVGSKQTPDISAITNSDADVVFCDNTLSEDSKAALKEAGIPAVTMLPAQDFTTLQTMYKSAGRVLGGDRTGGQKGLTAFDMLKSSLEDLSASAMNTTTVSTVAYIYTEQGQLKSFTKGTFGNDVLSYTGAVNVTENFNPEVFDIDTFLIGNPDVIFCDAQSYDTLTKDSRFQSLNAVKNNKISVMELDNFTRQGSTLVSTVYTMIYTIHPELYATPDEAKPNGEQVKPTEKEDTTSSQNDEKSVADDYDIEITEELKFKLEQEDDDVMALQKRLDDLGYLSVAPTGYYGELTVEAVKLFQKENGLTESGEPDLETLNLLFSNDAKKNPTPARDDSESSSQE